MTGYHWLIRNADWTGNGIGVMMSMIASCKQPPARGGRDGGGGQRMEEREREREREEEIDRQTETDTQKWIQRQSVKEVEKKERPRHTQELHSNH
jgi:hypothetical protein